MEKFRANHSSISIEKFEVVKETEKQVTFIDDTRERKEAKESNYSTWCNTFDEAKQALIEREQREIELAQSRLNYRLERMNEIKNIKNI